MIKQDLITMKNILFISTVLLIFYSCKSEQKEKPTILQVGVSKAVINPPLGSFIAGDKQNRTFTGIKDNLYAKAMVAYDGENAIALVTLDCIGLLYQDLQTIRKRAAFVDFGIPFSPENIIISSTHTHSGPDVVGLWGKDYTESGVNPEYMDFLIQTVIEQIESASNNLKPATAKYSLTEFGQEWVANICDEEIDRSVTTLWFLDESDKNIVSLTNFACHPTYLDAVFTEVSADYVAGFYKEMEQQVGGENLFLQGAIGGWIQPIDKDGDYENALKRGRELAEATITSFSEAKALVNHDIRFDRKTVFFPVENPAWQQLAAAGIFKREISDFLESEIVWFSIGEATFASHPGETAPAFGLETKAMMADGPKFVLGLTQDALGYILKPVYFEDKSLPHAPYLTSMSLGKQTGPHLMETLKNLSEGKTKSPVPY